ncbi:MAG TPA: carbohydrate ABC transporter permease [Candidatus Limnocylindrales bacterium]|nr:carbohydrate ABC transporter permease [Candidatus Limnocylindrales bacterium]
MRNPFARRSVTDLSPPAKLGAFIVLLFWAFVVLFPIYWLVVTSFKTPYVVDKGPFYIPFVDFQPTLDAWRYILVELGNDTLRPYVNTVIVGLSSSVIALVMGAAAAYALVRFTYRARIGIIGLGIGSGALAVVAALLGAPPILALASAVAVFAILAQTIGRRFTRALGNSDIAFWLISQRILPPIAVAIPLYVLYQQVGLLDNIVALIITYVATNLPIVVWLMRDYFASLPRELEESAAVDGASIYRIVRSIVLPISVPGLVATFLIVLIFAWNEFLIALVLTSADAQTMPLQVAAQNATRGPQWWAMSVLILIMITPVVAMAVALERFITRGILVGALKG